MKTFFSRPSFTKIYLLIVGFLIFPPIITALATPLAQPENRSVLSTSFEQTQPVNQINSDQIISPSSFIDNTNLPFFQKSEDKNFILQESFANVRLPVTEGTIFTGEEDSCILAIAEIAKCKPGNGSCVENAVKKYKKQCSPTEDKEFLKNNICLRHPSISHDGRVASSQQRIFNCQSCVGRGVGLEGAVDICKPENLKDPPKGNKVLTKNGQLSARISVTQKSRSANNDNIYLEMANQISNPFFGYINVFAENDELIEINIRASEIKNIRLNTNVDTDGLGGIVPSQNETCTFTYNPGPGWVIMSGPGTSQTNNGICSTTVKIKRNTQTVFYNFFELPAYAQTGEGVEVCVDGVCASINLSAASQVIADATTDVLNFFSTRCFFPGQELPDGSDCSPEDSLSVKILNFLLVLARIIVLLAIIYAGYLLMLGKEKEGRDALRQSVIGLVLVFLIATLVSLIERSISAKSTQPFAEFVSSIVSNFVIPIAGVLSLAYFVIGGYFVLTGGGNSNQVSKGWSYMRNAIIGLVVVILSFSIAQIITNVVIDFISSI